MVSARARYSVVISMPIVNRKPKTAQSDFDAEALAHENRARALHLRQRAKVRCICGHVGSEHGACSCTACDCADFRRAQFQPDELPSWRRTGPLAYPEATALTEQQKKSSRAVRRDGGTTHEHDREATQAAV